MAVKKLNNSVIASQETSPVTPEPVKYDWKVLLFRVLTVGYTAFLAGFCNQYVHSPDLSNALQAGLSSLIQGVVAGFGLDQIIFHYIKNTKS